MADVSTDCLLQSQHEQSLLLGSAITREVVAARGYRTVTVKTELRRLGFADSQAHVPTLLIPVWSVSGQLAFYQARPDMPRIRDGKRIKYETPAGVHMALDVHPMARQLLGAPQVPLFVTEGIKKGDALVSRGRCAIALLGVWNWRGSNEQGGKVALPDWEYVALNERPVYIVFDSDVMLKPEVHVALARLKAFLEQRGARVALIYLPSASDGAKVGVDDYLAAGHTLDDLLALKRIELQTGDQTAQGQLLANDARVSQATRLIHLAAEAELFHTPDGEAYARFKVADHQETAAVRSRAFRRWLFRLFFEETATAPGSQGVQDALGVLEGKALFEGSNIPVYTRLAEADEAIYLDLANDHWQAVEVGPGGWSIIAQPPVYFRRPRGMLALPSPVPGNGLDELRSFVNVASADDWALLLAWLIQAIRPRGPYPLLVLHGEQGSAKSTTARVLRALVDPNSAPLRAEPRNGRDLMIAANNGWVIALDNLSHVSPRLSDALCRLATGGGFATRELYTDGEEMLFTAMRPAILTGIEELATRADLLDRAVVLTLPRISEADRRTEKELWAAFEAIRPEILGGLLDAISTAMRNEAFVHLEQTPRMADFATWAVAAEPALGIGTGAFMEAYGNNRSLANEMALEASPLVPLLLDFGDKGDWTGTATDLLNTLAAEVGDDVTRKQWWPGNGRALSNVIRRVAPNLRAVGLEVDFGREAHTRRRLVTLRKWQDSCVPCVPSVLSESGSGERGTQNAPKGTQTAKASGTCAPQNRIYGDAKDYGDARLVTLSSSVPELEPVWQEDVQ